MNRIAPRSILAMAALTASLGAIAVARGGWSGLVPLPTAPPPDRLRPRIGLTTADFPPQPASSAPPVASNDDAPLPVTLGSVPPLAAAPDAPGRTRIIAGPMEDVLYGEAGAAAAGPPAAAQALKLFAHKLDLARDVALGDRVRLVLGAVAGPGGSETRLDYADIETSSGPVSFYRLASADGRGERFVDDQGADLDRALLRTPVAEVRVTSGFGWRLHPLLGYSRMHQGVDLGVPAGTPVLAAGDGAVEAARWAGGYGRVVVLRHDAGLETVYAHLSAWGPRPVGARVRQGEVIGWSGASGLATGPHLHFEVRLHGQAIDPARATPPGPRLDPAQQVAFIAQRRLIADLLARETPARLRPSE